MKQFLITKNKKVLAGIAGCLLIGGVTMSFQDTPIVSQIIESRNSISKTDTVPSKKDHSMTMKEFDQMMGTLDINMEALNSQLKDLNLDLIENSIEMSLKSLDMEQIMETVEASLKNIDIDGMMADVKISMSDEDWNAHEAEFKKEMEHAMKELEEAKLEIKNIDKEEIKREMAEAKREMEKAKIELKNIDMDKIMKDAQQSIDASKAELQKMRSMFTEMEKDGLIDTKKGFEINFEKGELFINGKKQTQAVSDKYRSYIKEDNFKIQIDKE